MSNTTVLPLNLRMIQAKDNEAVARLILETLQEFGLSGPGCAAGDPEIHTMSAAYKSGRRGFWVIEDTEQQKILGCGGYGPLAGTLETDAICELQKLYFKPQLRGQGWGKRLLSSIIEAARRDGYQHMYLESIPEMQGAIRLYEKLGFEPLDHPMGNTGHSQCTVLMSKRL